MRVGRREINFGRRRQMGLGRQRDMGVGRRRGMGLGRRRQMRWIPVVIAIWLIIGALAAGQRGYYTDAPANCATTGTILVTILAGPLNYVGLNPTIADCNMPQPSS